MTELRIADADAALFASDMHLDADRPALTQRFLDALEQRLARVPETAGPPSLFLLGDLFEFWVGDDHLTAPALAVAARLAQYGRQGVRIWLMHGNRDFLIDAPLPQDPTRQLRYSARCGAQWLAEPAVAVIGGRRVALCHGDALCTDDARYQQWRRLCRSEAWQRDLLGRPVADRVALARSMRRQSQAQQMHPGSRTADGMAPGEGLGDVVPAAVDALMTGLDVDLLIHGHTHRPGLHRWNGPSTPRQRAVLSDWDEVEPRGNVYSLSELLRPPR